MGTMLANSAADWPHNFIAELEFDQKDPLNRLDDAGAVEVAICLAGLSPREKLIIRMRYCQGATFREIADACEVTRERARQIERNSVLRVRRSLDAREVLSEGVKAYIDHRIETAVEERAKVREAELTALYRAKIDAVLNGETSDAIVEQRVAAMSMAIEELDLSTRAYVCMKRAGCETVEDIILRYPTANDALGIRNLGRKSMEEISAVLKGRGIIWPRYDFRTK